MENRKVKEEIALILPILKKIEECLRSGKEEETIELIREGLKVSRSSDFKNRLETLMISLL